MGANLPTQRTQFGRKTHSIRVPNLYGPSPNNPANGLWHQSSRHRAPIRNTPSSSETDTEPFSSDEEQPSDAETPVVPTSADDTKVHSSTQSSDAPTLVVSSSEVLSSVEDIEGHSYLQPSDPPTLVVPSSDK